MGKRVFRAKLNWKNKKANHGVKPARGGGKLKSPRT